ncbi:MAG TPA: hypothetical protein VFG20_01165 [Planctomycetaceae bacterium]|jgi:hypothetical protein|nr:hypothetical protein [Planctomycetaceae bacterium]
MTEHQFDSADAELTHGRGVETLFSYLIVGMGILALFVLGVFALGQSQQISQRAVQEVRPPSNTVTVEIGGSETERPR